MSDISTPTAEEGRVVFEKASAKTMGSMAQDANKIGSRKRMAAASKRIFLARVL